MRIIRILNSQFDIINTFLSSNFSSPTHWPDWNLVVSKHYNTDFFYFVAYDKDEVIGICPAHKTKKGKLSLIFSGQFRFIPNGGWIFKSGFENINISLPLNSNEAFQSFGLPFISEFMNSFYEKENSKTALTLIIDLDKDIEQIWNVEVHSKRRNMIRKAEKLGIQIRELKESELNEFYKVYTSANIRYGLDSLSKEFFADIFYKSKNIKFKVLLSEEDDKIQNIVVIAYDKNYATYWLGFSNDNIKNNGQGDLLQWEAIKFAKQQGCKYYDLCYIEKEKLPHIYKFKKGFAKNEFKIPIINQKPLSYKIINKVTKWL